MSDTEADITERVKQNSEALQQLKDLPLLVQELSKKLGRVKSSQLEDPPPSVFSPTIPLEGGSGLQNEYDSLIFGADGRKEGNSSKESEGNEEELDEVVTSLLADVEKGTEYGGPLIPHVAESFFKTISRPISKETASAVKNNVKIPENLKLLVPPKMNGEIWRALPSHARIDDLKKQQTQTSIAYGISALAQIANTVAKRSKELPADLVSGILKQSLDAANILGDQYQDLNSRRRTDQKRYINSQFWGICSKDYAPSEWLFGGELSSSLKESRASSAVIRPQTKVSRFTPYTRGTFQRRPSSTVTSSYQQNLNSPRFPSANPRRNYGSNHQRGSQFNQNNRQPPPSSFQRKW